MEQNTPSVLLKVQKDFKDNFISDRTKICISLTMAEIKELLLSEELNNDLELKSAWGFGFYLRQLMFASTAHMDKLKPLMDVLVETENKCMSSGNEIKAIWLALCIRHFLPKFCYDTLREITTGELVHDMHIAQIAYDELQKRDVHSSWIQEKKDLKHREEDL